MKFKPQQKVNTPYGPGVILRIAQAVAGIRPVYWVEYEYTATPKVFNEDQLSEIA